MRKVFGLILPLALMGLLALACSSSSSSSGDEDGFGDQDVINWDATGDTGGEPVACISNAECETKQGAAPTCQRWTCDTKTGCLLEPVDNGTACDDQDACTQVDQCVNGVCTGGEALSCNDMNSCTTDTCDPASGCTNVPADGAPCDDADLCTMGDTCQGGQCVGADDPKCNCSADADCAAFDDGDLCNGVKTCQDSQCVTDPASVVDCAGMATGACEKVACKASTGVCEVTFKPNGTACDDGNQCTLNDVCTNGGCGGGAVDCDDDNPCTDDSCDPTSGCAYAPNAESCDDGDLCTTADHCEGGVCTGTENPLCICSDDEDCVPYDDGDLCSGTLTCLDGKCEVDEATIVTCDDVALAPCEQVVCAPSTGECKVKDALNGTACSDSDACTENDVCTAGACVGTPMTCEDGNACTTDACDPAAGCTFTPNTDACDDGNSCTSGDACAEGVCTGTPNADCECLSNADCAEQEDEDACNGTLMCSEGQCVVDPNSVIVCPEPEGCTTFTCQPETGACVEATAADGSPCEDGNACTDGDVCDEGQCKGGDQVVCDDTNLCTDDSCDPTVGCQFDYNTEPCDDGIDCTENDACADGTCTGTPSPECVCAADADCDEENDLDQCNGTLICVEHKCVADPESVVTCAPSDPNGCVLNHCNPLTGECEALPMPDGKSCDDDSKCTLVDVCLEGACAGTGELECDDENACTTDICLPETGCVNDYNADPCDDGDPCTEGDACDAGVCQPGADVCGDSCTPEWTLSCGGTDTWSTLYYGATDLVDDYACSTFDYSGPEYTYRFEAPFDGQINVYLTAEEDDTDLLILDDTGEGCNSLNCREWAFSSTTLQVEEGASYFFVVDGYQGAAGGYTIDVECVPMHETSCDNGLDDDQDGLIDCDDEEDCLGTEACPIPHCEPHWTMMCGQQDSWWNYGGGSTDLIEDYGCNPFHYEGPEYTYEFTSPVTASITARMTGLGADLDLMLVTPGEDESCMPEACLDWGETEITFDAVEGETYYLVVDGFNDAQSSYTLEILCPTETEVNCVDELDDDQDGLVDCDDDDCDDDQACLPPMCKPHWPIECGGGESYNTNSWGSEGLVSEYGCNVDEAYTGREYTYTFVAPYTGTATVSLSEDHPSLDVLIIEAVDETCDPANACLDWDMETLTFDMVEGSTYYVVVDGVLEYSGGYTIGMSCVAAMEMSCTDEIDDDLDGLIDCVDPDCFGTSLFCPACTPNQELFCGEAVQGANDGPGATFDIDKYAGCGNPFFYAGYELTYSFVAPEDGTYTVTLTDETASTDVIVLGNPDESCNPSTCLDYGFSDATFEATAGATYYVVVDGFGSDFPGAAGTYTITMACP